MSRRDWELDRQAEEEYAARYGWELPHETVEREFDEELARRDRLSEKGPLAHAFRPALPLDEAA